VSKLNLIQLKIYVLSDTMPTFIIEKDNRIQVVVLYAWMWSRCFWSSTSLRSR